MKVEIREASESDIPQLVRFYHVVIRETYSGKVPDSILERFSIEFLTQEWETHFRDRVGEAILLFIDGALSGFCSSTKSDFPDIDTRLESIYVQKSLIGQRFGNQLLSKLVDAFQRSGHRSFHLWVLDENVQARDYYKRIGGIESKKSFARNFFGETLHSYVVTWRDLEQLRQVLELRKPAYIPPGGS